MVGLFLLDYIRSDVWTKLCKKYFFFLFFYLCSSDIIGLPNLIFYPFSELRKEVSKVGSHAFDLYLNHNADRFLLYCVTNEIFIRPRFFEFQIRKFQRYIFKYTLALQVVEIAIKDRVKSKGNRARMFLNMA